MFRKLPSIVVLLVSFAVYKYSFSIEDSPILQTDCGLVKGKIGISRKGKFYYEYLGIPYAKPPVGKLRFENPQRPQKWKGVKLTQSFGSSCAQINIIFGGFGSLDEDCLFLNVFTPSLDTENVLPVIVFIHGGLFVSGSSNAYGANYFMDEDVTLVTINYRLASFGFLNTGDGVVPGNMGLKDQVKALEWIQSNIKHFGGDKQRVTIIGESAGGACVHHHLLSQMSKGLFHRAISQSGTAFNSWALQEHPREQALRFASQLNCLTNDSDTMVGCLKAVSVANILEIHMEDLQRDLIALFAPTIEVKSDSDTFLSDTPFNVARSGNVNRVPWIVGYNSDEGHLSFAIVMRNETVMKTIDENFTHVLAPTMFYGHGDEAHKIELMEKVQKFYFGDMKPNGLRTVANYSKLFTDWIIAYGLSESIIVHSRIQPVFPYYYAYLTEFQVASVVMAMKGNYPLHLEALLHLAQIRLLGREPEIKGASHTDEMALLFQMDFREIHKEDKDYEMSKKLVKLWSDFAKGSKDLKIGEIDWKPHPHEEKNVSFLRIDSYPSLIVDPEIERLTFWRENALKPYSII